MTTMQQQQYQQHPFNPSFSNIIINSVRVDNIQDVVGLEKAVVSEEVVMEEDVVVKTVD